MSALALVGNLAALRPAKPVVPQPAPAVDVDLSTAVQRLAGLGVTVRSGEVARRAEAEWDADSRTVTLRPDTTVHAALWVLRDLYRLSTRPGHVSPSVPARHLRAVTSPTG